MDSAAPPDNSAPPSVGVSAASHELRAAEKRSAALASVIAAFGMTVLKLVTGLLTGSLGMLSEAAHSGIDFVAAALTLFSVHVSDRPADADHNYGHGKVESLSAFVETGLMLASCLWIIIEAVRRMVLREHLAVTLSIWPFLVLVLSIVVDFTRSRNLRKVARRYGSEALEADALHFGTDIWSSFAVLLGLCATAAGEHFHIPWLEFADPSRRWWSPSSSLASAGILPRRLWMPCSTPRPPALPAIRSSRHGVRSATA